jgi:predicted HicB family RNase H-like nuclease
MKKGRPKLPENQTKEVFSLRFSKDDLKSFQNAAARSGATVRTWATKLLLDAAERDKS